MYQLLGMQKPPKGTDWDLSLDYLSQRGFGYGTTYLYHTQNLFGIPGQSAGLIDFWGIDDHGYDNLGLDRSHLQPEVDYRYRFLLQHRQELPDGFQLTVEGGAQSDRNFLQEYFKHEWDELKDQTTDVELRQTARTTSPGTSSPRCKPTPSSPRSEWLPRGDSLLAGAAAVGRHADLVSSIPRPAMPTIASPPRPPIRPTPPSATCPGRQSNRAGRPPDQPPGTRSALASSAR